MIDFNIAYDDISPVGTTAPFRIRAAVTPGKSAFSVGMVYGYTLKDNLKIGSNGEDSNNFIHSNPAQPRAPKEIQVQQQALTLNYSPADHLALFMNVPWFERRLSTLTQTQPPRVPGQPIWAGAFGETIDNENELGDITLEGLTYGAVPVGINSLLFCSAPACPRGISMALVLAANSRRRGCNLAKAPQLSQVGCSTLSAGRISGYIPQLLTLSTLKMM